VADIARDEGYLLNDRKTRIMRRSACQRVTGLVVNDHLNIPRAEYDALKATLHNCARNGPRAENRSNLPDFRAHLDGRVVWVENANRARGRRLRQMFEAIRW
jgi:RNA-directed DNA polymerase